MKVKIRRNHPDAVLPTYSKKGDAGLDLTVVSRRGIDEYHVEYDFGISLEIPEGFVGLVFPRSSIYKKQQVLSNSVGVIDSGYRGSIKAVMIGNIEKYIYDVGERAAQLIIMPYPMIEFEEVDELSATDRGEGGYGSTGK